MQDFNQLLSAFGNITRGIFHIAMQMEMITERERLWLYCYPTNFILHCNRNFLTLYKINWISFILTIKYLRRKRTKQRFDLLINHSSFSKGKKPRCQTFRSEMTITRFDDSSQCQNRCVHLHSSWSLAVTVRTVCWISSFSSTSAS